MSTTTTSSWPSECVTLLDALEGMENELYGEARLVPALRAHIAVMGMEVDILRGFVARLKLLMPSTSA